MTNPEILSITKSNLLTAIDSAIKSYKVAALTNRGERTLYDFILNSKEIEFTYKPTVLSPKKSFFPQDEIILEYDVEGKVTTKVEAEPMLLFGIRPCDLNGIKMMHEAFADDNGDPYYLSKLEKSIVIGMDCLKVCDKHAFCFKVQTQNARGGYDIMLSPSGEEKFAVEIATDKGKNFVEKYFKTDKSSTNELADFRLKKEKSFGSEKPFKNLEKLPEILEENKHHPVWQREADRCLSCGSCIMVCPTCYCFDVTDDWQLNLKKGQRVRKWDACMLSSFAVVAGGENFRHHAINRLQHRIHRKFNYLMKKHHMPVCVGCGRCVRACLAEISPKTIVDAIVEK